MKRNIFFLAISVVISCISADIPACYLKRSHQYESHDYNFFRIYTPYRCGSTLIYNIARFLFEDFTNPSSDIVHKSHFAKVLIPSKSKELVVVNIRNPIDICYSRYRTRGQRSQRIDYRKLREIVKEIAQQCRASLEVIEKYPDHVLVLRYESFVDDLNEIVNAFERATSIAVTEEDRQLIKNTFSREEVIDYYSHRLGFSDFDNWDQMTHIHGSHIDSHDDPLLEKQRQQILKFLNKEWAVHKELVKELGYTLSESETFTDKLIQSLK